MSQENRILEGLNQQFLIESGTNTVGAAGASAYIIRTITKDGTKYNQSLHEGSGLSRQYAEKTLQVECGVKGPSEGKGGDSYALTAHKGDINIMSAKGAVLIKGTQITLDADDIVLQGTKIRIGYEEPGATDEVLVYGNKVHVTATDGNIGDLLKTSWLAQAFSGSLVQNSVLAAAKAGYAKGGSSLLGGLGGGGGLGGIAKMAATPFGGPVAGLAAETAVNSLTG